MLQRIAAAVLGLFFLAAVLVFASIAAGVLLAAGLLAWTWAWWRGRGRRARRTVIEGEYRDETHLEPHAGARLDPHLNRLSDLKRR